MSGGIPSVHLGVHIDPGRLAKPRLQDAHKFFAQRHDFLSSGDGFGLYQEVGSACYCGYFARVASTIGCKAIQGSDKGNGDLANQVARWIHLHLDKLHMTVMFVRQQSANLPSMGVRHLTAE